MGSEKELPAAFHWPCLIARLGVLQHKCVGEAREIACDLRDGLGDDREGERRRVGGLQKGDVLRHRGAVGEK
jgi:hypothetical protein